MDWEDVRVFVALARHGSLSGAARALSVNHATVARRIRALETALGEKLVDRRPHGYVLTEAGARTLETASEMEAAAARLKPGRSDGAIRGLVRVNAPPALTLGFLLPRLAKLSARHPGLSLDVASDVRAISLDRREADIAIRIGRPRDSDLLARQVGAIGFGFYATEPLARRLAKKEDVPFVSFDEANADLPEAIWLARHFPKARVTFRANNQLGQAAAARVGAGVGLLPHYIGRSDATLIALPIEPLPPKREVWLLKRQVDRKDPAIRTVAEYVEEVFAKERALFEAPAQKKIA